MTDLAVQRGESAGVWRERDAELISPAYSRYTDLVVDHALGAHLHTVDGRDVLDFGCGIGVTNLGHLHPAVVRGRARAGRQALAHLGDHARTRR